MRRIAIALAFLAPVAHADELRVRSGDTITVYSGELAGIMPASPNPARVSFLADTVTVFPVLPSSTMLSRYPVAWTVDLAIEGQQSQTLSCRGDVPAYIGMTFALDVVCQ